MAMINPTPIITCRLFAGLICPQARSDKKIISWHSIIQDFRRPNRGNKKGIFKFSLKPGLYTFFLVDGNKAYLNSFDGNGFFKGTKLTKPITDLLLLKDQNAIY